MANDAYRLTWSAEQIDEQLLKIPGLEAAIGDLSTLTTEQKANLVAAINELVTSVATKTKNSNISASFDTTKVYSAGDYAIHDGDLYRAKEDISAGAWDASKWTLISIGEDLAKKANRDDYCPDMTVGNAEQIVSSIGVTDTDPYNYRTSGGTSDIGNRAEEKKLVGGTLAWNQLVRNGNFADTSNWSGMNYGTISVSNNICTYTLNTSNSSARIQQDINLVTGHKYLVSYSFKASKATTVGLKGNWQGAYWIQKSIQANTWTPLQTVAEAPSNATLMYFYCQILSDMESGDTAQYKNIMLIDLTLALGPSIADFIYAKEQAHAGDGVAWFRQYFPKDYYPYNAGNLMSVLLSRKEITKLNQWDEQWELGAIDGTTGQKVASSNRIRSKNYIRVFPSTLYYVKIPSGYSANIFYYTDNYDYIRYELKANTTFETPQNCKYIQFYIGGGNITTYNHDICINLHWDASRDGEYEAYELIPYPLPNVELRGIWKLDANNKLYFDGDELTPSGSDNLKRRYKLRTFNGMEDWSAYEGAFYSSASAITDYKKYTDATVMAVCDKFSFYKQNVGISSLISNGGRGSFSFRSDSNSIQFYPTDSSITTASAWTTWLSNNPVTILYELETPTLETAGDYTAIQTVDDFGTEEFVDAREVAIPVGHETMYQANVGGFAESMYARGNGSPEEFVIQEELEQGLSNKASIEDVFTHVTITDSTTTLGDIKDMLDEINANGEHVFFDTYALGANTYVCTILIDADAGIYKMFDVVGHRVTEGVYDADKLLVVVLANLDNVASQKQIDNLQEQIDELGGSSLIKDYAVLKQKIADGTSTDAVSPGDKIDINWIDTVTGSTNKGNTVTCSDEWQFAKGVGECEERQYLFVYDGASWTYNEEQITLSDLGLSVSGTPSTGEVMTITTTVKTINFTFTGYDKSTPHESAIHHNWTLEQTYAPDTRVYDTYECLFTLDPGKTLAAGSYKLTNYSHRSSANLTVYFTLSSAVSNSGSTVIQFASQGYTSSGSYYIPSSMKAFQLASDTALTGAISISMTEIAGATDVSTVDGVVLPGSFDFAVFGNNNWALSNVRQYLNDESKTGTYTPSTNFDRPNAANRGKGWLYGIDPRAYDLIIGVDNKFTAGYGNAGYTQNQTYTSTDKVFLLSMKEMSFNINTAEGELLDLYGEYTNNTLTNDAVAARAKYNKAGGTLNSYRWSRSANVNNASIDRNVTSSGANNVNSAFGANYVAPAFCFGA